MGSIEQSIQPPPARAGETPPPEYQAFDVDAASQGGFDNVRQTLYRCGDCGAIVGHRDDHTRWHQHLAAAIRAAGQTADARLWSDR